jgi:Transglycosylase SLT domain
MSYLTIKIGAWFISGLAAFVLLWDASAPPAPKIQPGEQITITLNSVVLPTFAPTTTAPPKGCAAYVADAISAGWPADQAPTLARVMFRESRCDPLAFNRQDSNNGSRGLMQINGVHKRWLMDTGYIDNLDDLFNSDINLRAALHLWRMVGWSAWASTHG